MRITTFVLGLLLGLHSCLIKTTLAQESKVEKKSETTNHESPQTRVDLRGIACPVERDRTAVAKFSLPHLKGRIFFCDENSQKRFSKQRKQKTGLYLAEANFQLFATRQYRQVACPFSGSEFQKGLDAKISGQAVFVCCENCLQQINDQSTEEQKVLSVFTRTRFQFGFRFQRLSPELRLNGLRCPVSGSKISLEQNLEFNKGVVYFENETTKKAFKEERNRFTAAANWQLYQSGQFVQKHCPFSGAEFKKEFAVKLVDRELYFCCQNCVDQVVRVLDGVGQQSGAQRAAASPPDEVLKMLFSRNRYRLGFGKPN